MVWLRRADKKGKRMSRIAALTATLLLAFAVRLWLAAAPLVPNRQSFGDFPRQLGQWQLASEESIESRLEPVLGADDYLLRSYRNSGGQIAELFSAYYAVQHAGESMHSPKNCMAGAGWEPVQKGRLAFGMDASRSASVNSYIIEKDGQRFVMLYWYQVHGRMIASEYWLKAYLVWDAVSKRRRDGAMVRITVPIRPGSDGQQELQSALELGKSSLVYLPHFLPS